jgi:organic radical activating enzyme
MTTTMLNTGTLYHGGIMVNYQCNAACRHCLYACSPDRDSGYINVETAEKVCELLCKGGCRSVHIGGGEPFLDFEGLVMMVRQLNQNGIKLEYIETNAFWELKTESQQEIQDKLKRLLKEGVDTLCISIDPYHAEFIPYGAPLTLAKHCEKTGMNYFLWRHESLSILSKLDPQKTHSREDMEKKLSQDYIYKTARQFGINYGGRAVNIERKIANLFPAKNFTGKLSSGLQDRCSNLLSTGHFHVDKNGYFIPPGCTGIRIPLSQAIFGIPNGKYPIFEALYHGGITALLEFAKQNGFFSYYTGYPSKCNLCFHIRHFLSEKGFAELDKNHYEEALKYW